jgi:predicted nicotinamide N-methyase
LKQFLQLFNPLPGNQYLQVCTCEDDITVALTSMMERVDGKLNLALYNEENLNFTQPFRARPRDHDIVILKDIFHKHKDQEMILKLAYSTLANTAEIIIMEKKGIMDIGAMKVMLEEFEFRAANDIDIVDGYDLVIAKKMHMWGNGL